MKVCEVNGLCKSYPSFTLDDVSFSLEKGRVTGFVGRNGAGKTTTLKSMLGFVHPDKGEINYFGMKYNGNENVIRQRTGFSNGTVNFYPRKKIRDIALVTKNFYDSWDDEAYGYYLDLFSLDENKKPCELSEGMKVKCNLLLALSHRAELLILDEPTSGLDPFSRDEITDLFVKLKKEGVSILFSTHIISDIEKCADNIIYIRKGKIIISDTMADFENKLAKDKETLEMTMLRLEREARNEENAL